MDKNTKMFDSFKTQKTNKQIVKEVYQCLQEKDYNPIDQLVGYIISGDPSYIGLDLGDKTVGIAISDPLGYTAQGLLTLERVGIRKDTGKILDLVKEYECDTIVMGLPKKLDGSDSIQTEKVYEFRKMLENKMRSTGIKGIEIVWQDERLTTVMAEKVLIEADLSRKKRKTVIDKQAAVIILQSYLDKKAMENRSRQE